MVNFCLENRKHQKHLPKHLPLLSSQILHQSVPLLFTTLDPFAKIQDSVCRTFNKKWDFLDKIFLVGKLTINIVLKSSPLLKDNRIQ